MADALVRLREKFVSKSIFHTLFNEIIFIIQVKNIKKARLSSRAFLLNNYISCLKIMDMVFCLRKNVDWHTEERKD